MAAKARTAPFASLLGLLPTGREARQEPHRLTKEMPRFWQISWVLPNLLAQRMY
jgi:hypothetical protein